MSELRIRAAVGADVDAVLAFWAVAAEGTSVSDDPAGVATLIARDPEALLLAESVGVDAAAEAGAAAEIVGTVIVGFDGWRCHLYRLAVSPAHRRRGVASLLLTAAEERFKTLGGRRADAMVLDHNTLAHHAWSAAGYHREDEWSRWVKPLG
ncbi:MAG TPA: GNAT family N-acetyltransferase [Actinocrinis sp.]|nr:GNAT family N-acetyltransferase [Actinocrinis sp.]